MATATAAGGTVRRGIGNVENELEGVISSTVGGSGERAYFPEGSFWKTPSPTPYTGPERLLQDTSDGGQLVLDGSTVTGG